jgi:hypothetical protein
VPCVPIWDLASFHGFAPKDDFHIAHERMAIIIKVEKNKFKMNIMRRLYA